MAVVPSRPRSREAFSWDFARSVSASVGARDIRVHSRSVKWIQSSMFMRLDVSIMTTSNLGSDLLLGDHVDTPETSVRVRSRE